ncbi:MAG: hypothetical protein EON87_10440 [Brevundimonas sp.]|nr:MAG: hypothetical protein EON87_10440 [Brevundimonas sp.]
MVLQLARNAIVADQPPEIAVIDRHAARQGQAFRERHGRPAPLAAIAFQQGELEPGDETEIDRLLAGPLGSANVVFICLADDPTSVLMAVALRRGFARLGRLAPPLRLHRHGPHDLTRHLSALTLPDVDLTRISSFGGDAECSLQFLTGDLLDRRARAIHERYLGRTPSGAAVQPSQRPWAQLGQAYRQANRDQADYIPLRLASLAWAERPGRLPAPSLAAGELEAAARNEHRRWAASAELIGWRHGAVRDNARKHHPDLAPYETLSEAAKAKDRAVIGDMIELLAEEGVAVAPLVDVRLTSADPDDVRMKLEAVTLGAARVVTRLETDNQVLALNLARHAHPGLIWRIELDEPLPARLERLDVDARALALDLIERAEQVLVVA